MIANKPEVSVSIPRDHFARF